MRRACLYLQLVSWLVFACWTPGIRCDENCTTFSNAYQDRILGSAVATHPVSDVSLKYCTVISKTCCTNDIEEKLRETSRSEFEKSIKKILLKLSRSFKLKSAKFNEYFKDLLMRSKKDFHEMFKKTYGIVYEQNSYVFSDFFLELEKYFSYGKSDLAEVMDSFFNILYQKMFTVINGQFKFDDKYLGCVSEHMNELMPFGDVPQKLSLPLKRSFVAARTYAQSLNNVGDIVSNLVNLMPGDTCYNALVQMLHCSSCNGFLNVKVCNNFCLNVMKECLVYYTEVDGEWNSFVDALNKVQQRLLGPFNIEQVVEPINVKISEAIMNFQENSVQITNKVFNGCGKPPHLENLKRRRRESNNFSNSFRPSERGEQNASNRNGRRRKEKSGNEPSTPSSGRDAAKEGKKRKSDAEESYDLEQYRQNPIDGFFKFIEEIGAQVGSHRSFWKRLPYVMCAEVNVEKNRSAACWNGKAMSGYDSTIVTETTSSDAATGDSRRPTNTVTEQISALRSVTAQLRNAYDGHDVEFIDSEEPFDLTGAAAGSGSGFPATDVDGDGVDDLHPSIDGSGDYGGWPSKAHPAKPSDSPPSVVQTRLLDPNNQSAVETVSTTAASGDADGDRQSASTTPPLIGGAERPDAGAAPPNSTDASGAPSVRYGKMSLNAAIASYLLPTVVIWIGRSFNDWLSR